MVPVAQQVLTSLLIPLLGCGLPYPDSPARESGYDLLFEPFATRAPDGSLYVGSLFRAMFTEFPRAAPQPQNTEVPDGWFDSPGTGDDVHHFHQRRDIVCCFLSGHFLPKGEELPGSAGDSVLFSALADDADGGPNVSHEGSWKIKNKQESVWGSLELEVMLESLDNPARDSPGDRWQTKKALQVDMAWPLFAYGEINAGYNTISAQEMKLAGGTGIGVKLAAWDSGEVSLRGGSQVNYTQDPLRPAIAQNDKSRLLLELACQYALVGPLRLEYSGSATPAMSPLEGNRISQDVRLLLPFGNNGQFRLGAKRSWSDQPALRAAPDANQIYLGVGISR